MTAQNKTFLYLFFWLFLIHKSVQYEIYLMESDRLCTYDLKPKVIEVGRDDKSAIIIKGSTYFNTLSGEINFDCRFRVESLNAMGIAAVIQKMNFRRDEKTGECIDYIQFHHSNPFDIRRLVEKVATFQKSENPEVKWGEKFCGEMEAHYVDITKMDPTSFSNVSPNAFMDAKGRLDVRVHIANVSKPAKMKLELSVVFTSFFTCKYNMGYYKKCGTGDACIWHKLFHDRYVNCPFINCEDEGGCDIFYEYNKSNNSLTMKVLVAAVAGMFTMFLAFIAFLWIFRTCSSFCCCGSVPQRAGQRDRAEMRPVSTIEEDEPIPLPSAPPYVPPELEKDLPPPYDSLFPSCS